MCCYKSSLVLIVAFKTLTQGSVATHLRCGGIFTMTVLFSPDSDSEKSLKIVLYLMKL